MINSPIRQITSNIKTAGKSSSQSSSSESLGSTTRKNQYNGLDSLTLKTVNQLLASPSINTLQKSNSPQMAISENRSFTDLQEGLDGLALKEVEEVIEEQRYVERFI